MPGYLRTAWKWQRAGDHTNIRLLRTTQAVRLGGRGSARNTVSARARLADGFWVPSLLFLCVSTIVSPWDAQHSLVARLEDSRPHPFGGFQMKRVGLDLYVRYFTWFVPWVPNYGNDVCIRHTHTPSVRPSGRTGSGVAAGIRWGWDGQLRRKPSAIYYHGKPEQGRRLEYTALPSPQ